MSKQTLLLLLLFLSLFANDYSRKANRIMKQHVPLQEVSAFLKDDHPQNEKEWILSTLIRYRSEEAVTLFRELRKSNDSVFVAMAAFPLMNAGHFDEGFAILKELAEKRSRALYRCFYTPREMGTYSEAKIRLYKKYKRKLTPFVLSVAKDATQLPLLRYAAAQTLIHLDKREEAYGLLYAIQDMPMEELMKVSPPPVPGRAYNPQRVQDMARKLIRYDLMDIENSRILTVMLNYPNLSQYFHTKLPERKKLYTVTLNLRGNTPAVTLDGATVEVIQVYGREFPRTPYRDKNSLFISEVKYKDSARKIVKFTYPTEGIFGTVEMLREKDQWKVGKVEIVER